MNIKTAFLNKNFEEEVYMIQPEIFVSSRRANKVCKLKKIIYGLKQVLRSWNIHYDETVKSFSFIKNIDEPCIYKKTSGYAIVFLVLYADDIVLIRNDISILQLIKT